MKIGDRCTLIKSGSLPVLGAPGALGRSKGALMPLVGFVGFGFGVGLGLGSGVSKGGNLTQVGVKTSLTSLVVVTLTFIG